MSTIMDRVAEHGLRITATPADDNPAMQDSGNMDHWRVRLRSKYGRSMSFVFSKGFGHHGARPTAVEVLDCLASEAAGIENASDFEDWAAEYGYEADSRRAERTYKTTVQQAESLRRLLDWDTAAYQALLFDTESL